MGSLAPPPSPSPLTHSTRGYAWIEPAVDVRPMAVITKPLHPPLLTHMCDLCRRGWCLGGGA
jgi:hypothetical protein